MDKFLLITNLSFILFTSCIKEEILRTEYRTESKVEKLDELGIDKALGKSELNIDTSNKNGVLEIELSPMYQVKAKWLFDKTTEHEDYIPNTQHTNTCKVDTYLYDGVTKEENVVVDDVKEQDIGILIDGIKPNFSSSLRWQKNYDSIIITIDLDHFNPKSVTLINNSFKSISTIKNDTRRCKGYPKLKDIKTYMGPSLNQKEYFIFTYKII